MNRAAVHAPSHSKKSHCGCGWCALWSELWAWWKMGLRDETAREALRLARLGHCGINKSRPDCKMAVMVLARMRQEGFAMEKTA